MGSAKIYGNGNKHNNIGELELVLSYLIMNSFKSCFRELLVVSYIPKPSLIRLSEKTLEYNLRIGQKPFFLPLRHEILVTRVSFQYYHFNF